MLKPHDASSKCIWKFDAFRPTVVLVCWQSKEAKSDVPAKPLKIGAEKLALDAGRAKRSAQFRIAKVSHSALEKA